MNQCVKVKAYFCKMSIKKNIVLMRNGNYKN